MARPGLLQILDLFSDQPITEAALQASRLDHLAFPIRASVTTTRHREAAPHLAKSAIQLLLCRPVADSLIPSGQVRAIVQFSAAPATRTGELHMLLLRRKVASLILRVPLPGGVLA
jgi:hypothetical protein